MKVQNEKCSVYVEWSEKKDWVKFHVSPSLHNINTFELFFPSESFEPYCKEKMSKVAQIIGDNISKMVTELTKEINLY